MTLLLPSATPSCANPFYSLKWPIVCRVLSIDVFLVVFHKKSPWNNGRVLDFEAKGRGFESCRGYSILDSTNDLILIIFFRFSIKTYTDSVIPRP